MRVVFLGDGGIGKTCLLWWHATGNFPECYVPTVFDEYHATYHYKGKSVPIELIDSAGDESFIHFWHANFYLADVYCICFDVSRQESLWNVRDKWVPRIKEKAKPWILIGCKSDLAPQVGDSDALRIAVELGASAYVKTSAFDPGDDKRFNYLFGTVIPSVHLDGYNEFKGQEFIMSAINNKDSVPWRRCKLMVIGQGRAGKSSLVRALLGQPFEENLASTVTATLEQINTDVDDASWSGVGMNKANYTTELAIRAGMQRYLNSERRNRTIKGRITSHLKAASKTLFNYKPVLAERKKSINNARLMPNTSTSTGTSTATAAGDLFDENEVARAFDAKLFLGFKESIKEGSDPLSLTIWDYGGQTVFYTLHHLFLTRYGIYTIVFDMREAIENTDTCLDYLRFWLSSVKLHAPKAPVVAVGTFFKELSSIQQLEEINKIFNDGLNVREHYPQLCEHDDGFWFIPVDNRTGDNISKVQTTLEKLAREQPFVNQKVSMRWTTVLDKMLDVRQVDSKEKSWIELKKVREIAHKFGVAQDTETMLEFFHELGVIVHLTSTHALRNIVITHPQWLLEKLGKVIWDAQIHKGIGEKLMPKLKDASLQSDFSALTQNGLVSRDLLEFLWEGEQVAFLLDLMKRTLLLSDWDFQVQGSEKDVKYIIPSMITNLKAHAPFSGPCCSFDFDDDISLPNGIFQDATVNKCLIFRNQYVAHSCSKQDQKTEPKLYKLSALIPFGSGSMISLEKKGNSILLMLNESEPIHDALDCLSITLSMLRKLNQDVMHGGLKWKMKFTGGLDYDSAKEEKLHPWFSGETNTGGTSSKTPELNKLDLEEFLDSL